MCRSRRIGSMSSVRICRSMNEQGEASVRTMTTNHAYSALTPARCWASGAGAACSTAGNDIGASVVDHDDVVARGYGRAEGHHGAILPDLGPQHVPRIYGRADARAEFLESPR